jgi:hypothetical protein
MSDSHAIALSWRKSSASATGDCVEVALSNELILVRDSKQRLPYILEFTFSEWRAFLSGVQVGEFDPENLEASGAVGPGGQNQHETHPGQAS